MLEKAYSPEWIDNEVAFLMDSSSAIQGDRFLDVFGGAGRHSISMAGKGLK